MQGGRCSNQVSSSQKPGGGEFARTGGRWCWWNCPACSSVSSPGRTPRTAACGSSPRSSEARCTKRARSGWLPPGLVVLKGHLKGPNSFLFSFKENFCFGGLVLGGPTKMGGVPFGFPSNTPVWVARKPKGVPLRGVAPEGCLIRMGCWFFWGPQFLRRPRKAFVQ